MPWRFYLAAFLKMQIAPFALGRPCSPIFKLAWAPQLDGCVFLFDEWQDGHSQGAGAFDLRPMSPLLHLALWSLEDLWRNGIRRWKKACSKAWPKANSVVLDRSWIGSISCGHTCRSAVRLDIYEDADTEPNEAICFRLAAGGSAVAARRSEGHP